MTNVAERPDEIRRPWRVLRYHSEVAPIFVLGVITWFAAPGPVEASVHYGQASHEVTFAIPLRALPAFERATGAAIAAETFVAVQVGETTHDAIWDLAVWGALRGEGTDPRHDRPVN